MVFGTKMEAVNAAARDASEALSRYWAGRSMPVDPVQIAEALGIEVYQRRIPDSDICGALRREKGGRAKMLIESSDNRKRQRFTCAHEIGHFWRLRDQPEIERIDYRSSKPSDFEEVYANAFAAQLLMPADTVRSEWEKLRDTLRETKQSILADKFAVSLDAMGYGITNLGLA